MEELSFHILDISHNSISAGAQRIVIEVAQDTLKDRLTIRITDDGCGMDEEFLKRVVDPFTTTRKTRKIGLGIPLLKLAAELTGGFFEIRSEIGKGTSVTAVFVLSSIDRAPLGDMAFTMVSLIMAKPEIDFVYLRSMDDKSFTLDTAEIRRIMEDVPIDSPEVLEWIRAYIEENEKNIMEVLKS